MPKDRQLEKAVTYLRSTGEAPVLKSQVEPIEQELTSDERERLSKEDFGSAGVVLKLEKEE